MGFWSQTRTLMRAQREGASLGDLAVMKVSMMFGNVQGGQRPLAPAEACLEVDMPALRRLPDGTVGREFARHLDDNGLQPLTVSPAVRERYADNPYAMRYATTHDLMHVLTGFPTTPAGELGLVAFMVGQGFAGGDRKRLWRHTLAYVLLMPLHAPGILRNRKVGVAMGEGARRLSEAKLDDLWAEPLDAVRRRFGLPDPRAAGVARGHASLLFRWLVPKPGPAPEPAQPVAG